ncbi:hypothetical protein ACFL51_01525 [Myxococcota bacterium]
MSLTGLWSEASEIMEAFLNFWNTVSGRLDPVSLAGLKLQLLEILDKSGHFVGQMGQECPDVTGRPDFVTTGKHKETVRHFGTGCHWPAVTDAAEVGT